MTPLYDVLSAWPVIGPRQLQYDDVTLAMALRGKRAHYKLTEIRHWQELADLVGIAGLWERMVGQVERAPAAIKQLESQLPADFPGHVYDSVRKGVARHAKQFLNGVDASRPGKRKNR